MEIPVLQHTRTLRILWCKIQNLLNLNVQKNYLKPNQQKSSQLKEEVSVKQNLFYTKACVRLHQKDCIFPPLFFIFSFSAENGCEVGGGVGKFFGPSLKKVRDVTLRRHNDRQRQLEQIQVDRQLQLTRDYEARANFRKTFHTRTIHARPTPLAPMGKGMKFIQSKKRQFSTIFNFIFQTAMTEFSRSGKFNLAVVRQKLQKTLWTSSRQRWIGSFIADMTLTQ